eukprot:3004060-Pleurochrysis_carterae.AAC.2
MTKLLMRVFPAIRAGGEQGRVSDKNEHDASMAHAPSILVSTFGHATVDSSCSYELLHAHSA